MLYSTRQHVPLTLGAQRTARRQASSQLPRQLYLQLGYYDETGRPIPRSPMGAYPVDYSFASLSPNTPCWALASQDQITRLVEQEGLDLDPTKVSCVDEATREILANWSWEQPMKLLGYVRLGSDRGWITAWNGNLTTVIEAARTPAQRGFRSVDNPGLPIGVRAWVETDLRAASRAFATVPVPCIPACWQGAHSDPSTR